jgi:hypothetical protein
MNNLIKIYTLKNEAQSELYEWFDKEVRQLTKNSDGVVDPYDITIFLCCWMFIINNQKRGTNAFFH